LLFEYFSKYERLRIQEQDVLRHMYALQTELPSLKNSNIKLTETNDLSDNQKNQFEELQRENNRLKQERRSKYLNFVLIRYIFFLMCSYSKET